MGDDGAAFYQDTCSHTSDANFVLTGSDMRTCSNDGTWSGTDVDCVGKTCTK